MQQVLTKKKEMDLFTRDGLAKQTGVSPQSWDRYIIKELIDNAIDSCESANIDNPKIEIVIDDNGISVKDNGTGISKKNLNKILDLNTYAGSKHYYKRPTRGAQGNALLTLSMPYAFNKTVNTAVIRTLDKEYSIICNHNEVFQESELTYIEKNIQEIVGTEIKLIIL